MSNIKKGFTLIELLVVIAIIGILATVVLASLGTARTRANDAKAQAQLSGMRAQMEIVANGGAYSCTGMSTTIGAGLTGFVCNPASGTATAWAAQATLSGTNRFFCVDSTGASKETTATVGTNTVCP